MPLRNHLSCVYSTLTHRELLVARAPEAPEEILPEAGPLAAVVSGFFAERAGKPKIPTVPQVRVVQRQQLRTALPWAVRALELEPHDGPAAG